MLISGVFEAAKKKCQKFWRGASVGTGPRARARDFLFDPYVLVSSKGLITG